MRNLRYTVSLDADGKLVFIQDAGDGLSFCSGCGGEMVARQGKIRSWHYAHKAGQVCTAPETALHCAAKEVIVNAFQQALVNRKPYMIRYP